MLYSTSTGNGQTIVLIHGMSQSTKVWKKLILEPTLSSYKLFSIDLPGHGNSFRSTDPDHDYTLIGMASHIKESLTSLLEDYIVVTNSLAGNLVAEHILELPKCKGIFLTGTSIVGSPFTLSEIAKPNPYFGVTFNSNPTEEELEGLMNTLVVEKSSIEELKQMFRATDPVVRTEIGKAISNAAWTDEVSKLEQVQYPVAVVFGKDEEVIFPDYLSRSKIKLWKKNIIKIKEAGHCCQLDQPEILAKLIDQYASDVF